MQYGDTDENSALHEQQGEFWEQPFTGYEVLNILGYGTSGSVLHARDNRFERDVVLKTLVPHDNFLEGAVERFFYEARQVARLRHANVVRALDAGRGGKYFFIAMEYVRGNSLQQRLDNLQQGKIREVESLKYIVQAVEGLQFIFEQGLAHRDIKPVNLMLGNDGTLRIADFGIAKDLAFASQQNQALANCEYVSPEIAADEPNIDIRSDLYSLGCCWVRMLLGRPPFASESQAVTLRQHISDDPVAVHEVDPRITPATGQLILWLLQKERDKRPKNPQQFLSKLMTHPLIKLEQEKEAFELEEQERAAQKSAAMAAETDEDFEGDYDSDDLDEIVGTIYSGPGAKNQEPTE